MKSAGKARNNGLYRHIRTSKEIIRNLLNDYWKITLHRKTRANAVFRHSCGFYMLLLCFDGLHFAVHDLHHVVVRAADDHLIVAAQAILVINAAQVGQAVPHDGVAALIQQRDNAELRAFEGFQRLFIQTHGQLFGRVGVHAKGELLGAVRRNRSIIPRYRKVVVLSTHTAENHDFISSDQGSKSSTSKSLFRSARSGNMLSR